MSSFELQLVLPSDRLLLLNQQPHLNRWSHGLTPDLSDLTQPNGPWIRGASFVSKTRIKVHLE